MSFRDEHGYHDDPDRDYGDPTPADIGRDMQTLAEEGGPQAVGLVVELLESSRREQDSIHDSVVRHLEEDRDRWKSYAESLEMQLEGIQRRLDWLMTGRVYS